MKRLSVVGALLLTGCVYYNGVYNAKHFAKQAEHSERLGRTSEAADRWRIAAIHAESVVTRHPRSRWADDAMLIRAKALVTDRIGVMTVAGKRIHHVGMPWHWGWAGLAVGEVVNDLTAWVGDPNVSIHEGKAFVCNVERA